MSCNLTTRISIHLHKVVPKSGVKHLVYTHIAQIVDIEVEGMTVSYGIVPINMRPLVK